MAEAHLRIVIDSTDAAIAQLREVVREIDAIGDESQESARQADALLTDLQRIARQSLDAPVEDQERLAREARETRLEIERLNSDLRKLASTQPVQDPTKNLQDGAQRSANVIRGIPALLGAIGVTVGLAQVVQAFTDAAKTGETFSRSLNIITGSAEGAAAAQERLLGISQKYGLEVTGLERAFTNFQASVAGTNFEGERGNEIFEAFAGSLGLLGKSSADIEGALLAVNQIISKNTVSSEELRQQLAERLPGAFRLSAEAMGLTTAELSKQLELGNITADQLLPKLAQRLQEAYSLDTVERVEGLSAAQNRLSTATTNLFRAFANTGAAEAMSNALEGLSNIIIDITQAIDGTSDGVFGLAEKADDAKPAIQGLGETAATAAGQIGQIKTEADAAKTAIAELAREQARQAEINRLNEEYIRLQGEINELLQQQIGLQAQIANESDPLAADQLQVSLDRITAQLDSYRNQINATGEALRTLQLPTARLEAATELLALETRNAIQPLQTLETTLEGLSKAHVKAGQALKKAFDDGLISADQYKKKIEELLNNSEQFAAREAEQLNQRTEKTERATQATGQLRQSVEEVEKAQEKATRGAQSYAAVLADLITQTRADLGALSETAAAVFDALLPDALGASVTLLNRNIQAIGVSLRGANDESARLKAQLDQAAESVDFFADRAQFAEPLSRVFYNIRLAAERVKEEFFSQKLALDDLLNRFDDLSESGGAGLDRLADRAERTANSFSLLSDADLAPLRQQIASVRDEMQRLEDQANSTLASLQERLLRLRGEEAQLLALQYERERLAIEQQLQQAKASGDRDAIAALEKSLQLLQQINKEEQRQLAQREDAQRQREGARDRDTESAENYLNTLQRVDEAEESLSRARIRRAGNESQAARGSSGGGVLDPNGNISLDLLRRIDAGLVQLARLRA